MMTAQTHPYNLNDQPEQKQQADYDLGATSAETTSQSSPKKPNKKEILYDLGKPVPASARPSSAGSIRFWENPAPTGEKSWEAGDSVPSISSSQEDLSNSGQQTIERPSASLAGSLRFWANPAPSGKKSWDQEE